MTPIQIERALLWSALINYAILIVWFCAFAFARPWMYRLHNRWFKLSEETFSAVHYGGMSIYKIGILLLNLAPMIAIYIVFGRNAFVGN